MKRILQPIKYKDTVVLYRGTWKNLNNLQPLHMSFYLMSWLFSDPRMAENHKWYEKKDFFVFSIGFKFFRNIFITITPNLFGNENTPFHHFHNLLKATNVYITITEYARYCATLTFTCCANFGCKSHFCSSKLLFLKWSKIKCLQFMIVEKLIHKIVSNAGKKSWFSTSDYKCCTHFTLLKVKKKFFFLLFFYLRNMNY